MIEVPMMLAQSSIDPSGWADFLLNQGVLGFVVSVLLFFLIKKDRQVESVTEKRLEDVKKISEVIRDQTVTLQASTKADDQMHQALDSQIRISDKNILLLEQLIKEIQTLREEVKAKLDCVCKARSE